MNKKTKRPISNLSLTAKTFFLLVFVVLLSIIPVTLYSITATNSIAKIGTDTDIDKALTLAIDHATENSTKELSVLALKKYRQGAVMRESIVNQVIIFSIAYAILFLVLVLCGGFLFVSRITRPLKELTAAAQLVALDKLTYRLTSQPGGEMGTLFDTFNAMADDIVLARKEKIMADRRATWQRVARTIAHEIKNPLTPIKLSTERMFDKFLNNSADFPAVIRSTTTTILTEIEHLQKLVDSFNTYAKFPEPNLTKADILPLINEVIDLFKAESSTPKLILTGSLPLLFIDNSQIRGALINLVKNGIEAITQASRSPGNLTITASYTNKEVHISIADNGIGISQENQARLFQPYFTTKKEGNGIGLALCERIMALHEGSILCESTQEYGTTFTLIFPVKDV